MALEPWDLIDDFVKCCNRYKQHKTLKKNRQRIFTSRMAFIKMVGLEDTKNCGRMSKKKVQENFHAVW